MENSKQIAQGAEAKIFLSDNIISKQRIPKSYRHPALDNQIRKQRTRREGRILNKALQRGVNVPEVLNINQKGEPTDKFNLELEFIPGDRLSETLNNYPKAKQKATMKKLGEQTAKLHENDIIHADLTTSNTILSGTKVYIIDFGLGFISAKIEDKAVDLHLIKQALEAKHWENWKELFNEFLEGYQHKETKAVVERLEVVESRGRYKH
ncbi:Kae1-associated serine/threonine protein kinase [archaeon]|nr:Kae1-associated serine/threonine protein kinase [archaeon]